MNKKITDIEVLKKKAVSIRCDIIDMLYRAESGHPGGSLSIVEILVALYYSEMNVDPQNPDSPERDIFILSKGHGCPTQYAILADLGFFPREELWTLRKLGSRLQGHPQRSLEGIEAATGSLGQGLSMANGFALSARSDKSDRRVYCVMGDGETQEGQIWEAVLSAAHYKLDNLCAVVDKNNYQIDGQTKEVKAMDSIADKWRAFNWNVIEIDGHDMKQVVDAFAEARTVKGKPTVIIAETVKGKGVSFMECVNKYHGVTPTEEEKEKAIKELQG